jgi:uncharacterized protein (DUF1330 family)
MAKGYWIARVDVRDAERYKDYVAGAKVAFDKYGARFLARGGTTEKAEGVCRARNVARIPSSRSNSPGSCRWRDCAR